MFNINTEITPKRVAELLCTGFEGGDVGYWCRIMDHQKPKNAKMFLDEGREDGRIWPSYDYPLLEGGAVICRRYDDEEETDEKYTPLVLNKEAIEKGLKIMADKYPSHFANFIGENEDSVTGDVFIQCCLLGDVEYG